MRNEYTLSLDLKKRMSHITPIFLQHDSATLYIKPFDAGVPLNMTPIERIEVAHKRADGKVIVGFGRKHTFSDGTMGLKYDYLGSEMNYAGDVQTTISMFTVNSKEKISMLPITVKIVTDNRDYAVEDVGAFTEIMKEATKLLGELNVALNNANTTTEEMRRVITTANQKIQRMDEQLALISDATNKANKATQDAIVATTATLEATKDTIKATQEAITATTATKNATQESITATQEAIAQTIKTVEATQAAIKAKEEADDTRLLTEAVRVATEQERLNTVQVREATEKTKADTDKVREDTLTVQTETEKLRVEMVDLKTDTETVRDETIDATNKTIQATADAEDATELSKQATQNSVQISAETSQIKEETQLVKDATEAVRVATEASRVSTETVRDETEIIRGKTEILYGEVDTLKSETEIAKNDTLVATQKANEASDTINQKVQEYDEHIYDYEYLQQYDPAKTYKKHNQVYLGRNSYIAIQDVPAGESPPTNPTQLNNQYWNMFAIGGIDGQGSVKSVNNISPDPSTFDVDLRVAKQMKIIEPIPSELSSKNISVSDVAPSNPQEGDFWVSFDDDIV